MSRWMHFKIEEFTCSCGCDLALMQYDFIDRLDTLRSILGFPLIVSSGYRCPSHNEEVSTTGKTGPHTTGRAVDFAVHGEEAYKLLAEANKFLFSGIGVNQKSAYKNRFIHLDDLPVGEFRPRVWTY